MYVVPDGCTHHVFSDALPSQFAATLSLLRKRQRLARELADDVMRARGFVKRNTSLIGEGDTDGWVDASLYDNDKYHGFVRWYRADGSLSCEVPHVDGNRHGFVRSWHSNGMLRSCNTLIRGLYDGLYREWSESGILLQETSMKNDKYDGLSRRWRDEDGTLSSMKIYQDGRLISATHYPRNAPPVLVCYGQQ